MYKLYMGQLYKLEIIQKLISEYLVIKFGRFSIYGIIKSSVYHFNCRKKSLFLVIYFSKILKFNKASNCFYYQHMEYRY